jgi:DNA-binding MltR family transcriptional regulator
MEIPDSNSPERIKELNAFLVEFQQESDRGAALLGAAMIDDCLRKIIVDFLIDKKKVVEDLVDGGYAPLSTFSARAKIVYCLGLISQCEYFNIDIIRAVRNKFAHQLHGLTFNDSEIVKLCRKLKYEKSAFGLINLPTPRHSFTLATAVLVTNLNKLKVNHRPDKTENNNWEPMPSLKWK